MAVTLACFWPVRHNDFVSYDDQDYVTENSHVQQGVTWQGVLWAFRTGHAANWHPLTWLTHMLDCQLYGLNPWGHHLTSLFFHIANTLLLFVVLQRMTGAQWRSAFVAALFAVHPLHVESVAWVAERKDVLSTFFGLLAIWAYACYAEKSKVQSPESKVQGPKSAVQGSKFKVQGSEEENIEHGTLNAEPDTEFIEISVTDSGEGISTENMKKLFQPLFTTKAKGIGLGLTVCRNLTEANDGRIEVKSELGKGTTFTIILPIEG
jgi:hypothetical protein